MQPNFLLICLIASVLASVFICLYIWLNPGARGSKSFAATCSFSILWTLGEIIARFGESFTTKWIGEIILHLGAIFLPVALFVFIYQYCGKTVSRKTALLLAIIPGISCFVLVTNPLHFLFFSQLRLNGASNLLNKENGIYYMLVHLPYSYILFFIGIVIALFEFSRASRHYRTQISILLFSLCIPFVANVIGVFKLLGGPGLTVFSFPVFFSIMAIAIFRYRFLVSNPIAYETVFQTIRDGVIIIDGNNIVMDINPAAAKTLNRLPKDVIGTSFEKAFGSYEDLLAKYKGAIDLYDEVELKIDGQQHFISVSITPLLSSSGTFNGRIFMLSDITDRKHYEASLKTMAFHDTLTRLANRRKFQEEFERGLEKAEEQNYPLAILYFDLNRFKEVNDTLGHEVGDELLKYIAARVASILRKPDLAARLGGDEFAVLLHNCTEEEMEKVIERVLDNVQRPFKVGDHTLTAEVSYGTAFYPKDGQTLSELLRCADAAMYQAKQRGRIISFQESEIPLQVS